MPRKVSRLQFCKPIFQASIKSTAFTDFFQSSGNRGSAMVSDPSNNRDVPSTKTYLLPNSLNDARTCKKSLMEDVCLDGRWQSRVARHYETKMHGIREARINVEVNSSCTDIETFFHDDMGFESF